MASFASSTSGLIWACAQCFAARDAIALVIETFAFADQSQRQMRQRSQIAARANAALRGNERSHAAIEHLAKRVDDDAAHAGESLGEGIGAQQHHCPSFRNGKRLADSDGVGSQQIYLQFANLVAGNAHIAEFADAGGDRIGEFVACNQCSPPQHGRDRLLREHQAQEAPRGARPQLRAPLPE